MNQPRIDMLRKVHAQAVKVDNAKSWWTPRSKLRARRVRRECLERLIVALSLPYDATEAQVKSMDPQAGVTIPTESAKLVVEMLERAEPATLYTTEPPVLYKGEPVDTAAGAHTGICPTSNYPNGSIRSDGTHRDLKGHTGNYNDDLPGSPGPYWWS